LFFYLINIGENQTHEVNIFYLLSRNEAEWATKKNIAIAFSTVLAEGSEVTSRIVLPPPFYMHVYLDILN
jgi:hypothetical protein